MTKSDFFTALPSNISALVIAEYLNVADIVRLDTAFCGKDARNRFLALYQDDGCVLKVKHHSVVTFTIPTFSWLVSRSLSVQGISLHKTWNQSYTDKLIAYAKECGKKVMFFHPGLDRGDTMSVVQFKSIMKQCPELTMLVGIPVSFVTEHAMKVVRQSNPKLMSLTVFPDDGSYTPGDLSALTVLVEGGLPALKILRLPFTEDLDSTLEEVARNCSNLEVLEVKSTGSDELELYNGDAILAALSACKNLETLVMPAHSVSDDGLFDLAKCFKLKVLELSHNALAGDGGFEVLSKGCPLLEELRLPHMESVKVTPRFHAVKFPTIQKLSLRCCTALADRDIAHLAAACPKLTDVDLYMCTYLTDASVCALSTRCPLLEQLNIVGLRFTDATFAQFAKTSTNLTHLMCTPQEPFDEREGVIAAFTHLTKLQHINVEQSALFNDPDVVATLLKHCTKLHTVETMYAVVCEDIMKLMASATPPFQYCGEGVFQR